jgi:hypothetical protein
MMSKKTYIITGGNSGPGSERSSERSYNEENAKEIWNLSDRIKGMEGESL